MNTEPDRGERRVFSDAIDPEANPSLAKEVLRGWPYILGGAFFGLAVLAFVVVFAGWV